MSLFPNISVLLYWLFLFSVFFGPEMSLFPSTVFHEYFCTHCRFLLVWRVRGTFFPLPDGVFLL